jgi:hypothetical protein
VENPTTPVPGIYTAKIGTNDVNDGGVGAYEAVYHTCHLAALSWMAIVHSCKVFAQNAACVKTGAWSEDDRRASERFLRPTAQTCRARLQPKAMRSTFGSMGNTTSVFPRYKDQFMTDATQELILDELCALRSDFNKV